MTAAATFARCIIFEKLDFMLTLRAFDLKDCPWLPVLGILSGTFHIRFLTRFDIQMSLDTDLLLDLHDYG
jgi:hypothetical protein